MTVTITQLRQKLFQLADRALEGETIEFTYKGRRLRVVPEQAASKLSRLAGEPVIARGGIAKAAKALRREMEAEWNKDWAEL